MLSAAKRNGDICAAEPTFHRSHIPTCGRGPSLHPPQGGRSVEPADSEEERIGEKKANRPNEVIRPGVYLINDEDQVPVRRAERNEEERIVIDEVGPEGIGGVAGHDHRHDRGDEEGQVAAAGVGVGESWEF